MLAHPTRGIQRTISFLICLPLIGCAADDFYQKRADLIRQRADAFHSNLKADRVEAAMHENQEIEAMAVDIAEAIKKRGRPTASDQLDQEWRLLNTAMEASSQNWLALGRHFTRNRQYSQAFATYQRLLASQTGEMDRPCLERTARSENMAPAYRPPRSDARPSSVLDPDRSRAGPRPDSGPSNPDPGPIDGESGNVGEPRSGLRGGT